MSLNIAVIVGSNRKESINLHYAKALAKLGEGRATFNFVAIDNLPMYNQDLEGNRPAEVNVFADEVLKNDAILIVTPEYNRSIPAVLKNAIDWGSRGTNIWGKPTAITGTSPGAIGTAAVQQHLRAVLGDIGGTLVPGEVYLTYRDDLFEGDGTVTNPDVEKFLKKFVDKFLGVFEKLK